VQGKVSLRHVPDQSVPKIVQMFKDYLTEEFAKMNTGNKLKIDCVRSGDWWLGDPSNTFYRAASTAIEEVWGMKPIFIREGGTIPITSFLEKSLQAPALLLPLGQSSDSAHLKNERLRLENLIKGKEVFKYFFKEIGRSGPNNRHKGLCSKK